MTIQEQLIKLNNTFEKLHFDFSAVETQQKGLEFKYSGVMNSIKEKWQVECNAALYSRRKKHFIFNSINTITALSFR